MRLNLICRLRLWLHLQLLLRLLRIRQLLTEALSRECLCRGISLSLRVVIGCVVKGRSNISISLIDRLTKGRICLSRELAC